MNTQTQSNRDAVMRAALKMAIDKLENHSGDLTVFLISNPHDELIKKEKEQTIEVIQACKEALATEQVREEDSRVRQNDVQPAKETLSDDKINKMAIDCGFQKRFDDVVVKHSNGSWVIISEKLRKFADEIQKENLNLSEKQYTFSDKQPAQEPVSKTAERDYNFMRDLAIGTEDILNEMLSAKPIAWTKQSELDKTTTLRSPIIMWKNKYASIENNVPLYTHPTPSWQGLSDTEYMVLASNFTDDENMVVDEIGFARAIEAKLKEKNYG